MAEVECSAERPGLSGRRWWLAPGGAIRSAEATTGEIAAARLRGQALRRNPQATKSVRCWQCDPANWHLLEPMRQWRYLYLCTTCVRVYVGGVDATDYSGGPFSRSLYAGLEEAPVSVGKATPLESDGFWDVPLGGGR